MASHGPPPPTVDPYMSGAVSMGGGMAYPVPSGSPAMMPPRVGSRAVLMIDIPTHIYVLDIAVRELGVPCIM